MVGTAHPCILEKVDFKVVTGLKFPRDAGVHGKGVSTYKT